MGSIYCLVPLFSYNVGMTVLVSRFMWRTNPDTSSYRPIGIAVGLAISSSYNSQSSTTLAVEGILDAISAGILLYTGLVEVRQLFESGA
jgi:hypothetical protein